MVWPTLGSTTAEEQNRNLVINNPSYLKYVATLPCNLSLMACFADINVSQGSVATYARCSGSFNIRLTTNSPRNFPVKTFLNRFRLDRIMVISLWPHFFGPPCRAFQFGQKSFDSIRFDSRYRIDFFRFYSIRQSNKFAACTLIFK